VDSEGPWQDIMTIPPVNAMCLCRIVFWFSALSLFVLNRTCAQIILLLSVLVCSCDCPFNVGVFPCGIQVSGQAGGGSFKIETLIV